jgi:hypothetical protein
MVASAMRPDFSVAIAADVIAQSFDGIVTGAQFGVERIADAEQFVDHEAALPAFHRDRPEGARDDTVGHLLIDAVADANSRMKDLVESL